MWNKFKQHFSHLFHPDDEQGTDEEKDVIHRDEKQVKQKRTPYRKIDTKVTYYYPKEREFKFPVSIDEVGKSRESHRQDMTLDEKEDRKSPKEGSNKPFKVTEIPSPVYGFKKRLQKTAATSETAQIMRQTTDYTSPAYVSNILSEVRRTRGEMSDYAYDRIGQKRQVPVETEDVSRLNEKDTQLDVQPSLPEQNEEDRIEGTGVFIREEQEVSNTSIRMEDVNDVNTSNEVNAGKLVSQEDKPTLTQSTPVHQEVSETDEQETVLKRSPVHEPAKREMRKGHTPFNVRMRPSDKKRYYDRLKQQEQINNQEKTKNQTRTAVARHDQHLDQVSHQSVEKRAMPNNDLPLTVEKSTIQALPLHLLNDPVVSANEDDTFIREQSTRLIEALSQFNVRAEVVNVMQGPSVTRFEIKPETGVKVSKVKNLSDDLKLSLAAKDIRIEAPIPGKHAIGIEVPNDATRPVMLSEILASATFQQASSPLTVGLGLDISGEAIVTDLQKMPHGLIAGATGSGKSVCINTILLSLLYKATPEEVRLLLIDPKMVELQPYNALPHLVSPVITDVKAATQALKWAVEEMERRYQQFVESGARDLSRYNEKMRQSGQATLPMIVIVIDELADLMMAAPQDVEDAICRIAQKARAAGIHLLLATQRPSVDVVTGLIKSNIPSRIAFSVASQVDSRTMIDTAGAERLLGKGDMLFVENGARHPVRIQGAYVSDDEIERVTRYLKQQSQPNYLFEQEELLQSIEQEEMTDELYDEALNFVSENETISTSLLQRRFKIGYNRAARIIDSLENQGIVSGQNGSKPRTILVSKEELTHLRQTER
ncbi:DNA translocase FtsK [Halolactibacillus miurensis]|uniref:DNA segregation ATPase FtsK/SpoIIIE, S-DNA-T family n=1 Tax=Halolactibacillus miurensis TaxID=306541 RepID=A0A1I6UVG7_9BACI|nr:MULTISPECIES: DNA translocase FtsK [Halolactibacillus]GEM05570.1 DNA translocase FtsK [Halolactibacillus miurensis]SFT05411.1 DNA segregation ATPase FtsK/SpoIIIE, S-DNA-T family [Halolactibacillus miurensis]